MPGGPLEGGLTPGGGPLGTPGGPPPMKPGLIPGSPMPGGAMLPDDPVLGLAGGLETPGGPGWLFRSGRGGRIPGGIPPGGRIPGNEGYNF